MNWLTLDNLVFRLGYRKDEDGTKWQMSAPHATCFSFENPQFIVTAAHAVREPTTYGVAQSDRRTARRVLQVEIHPDPVVDIAALWIETSFADTTFKWGSQADEAGLGVEVMTYGYHPINDKGGTKTRLMQNIVQCVFDKHGRELLEIGFPGFYGLSGAPVILNFQRETAIGVMIQARNHESVKEGEKPIRTQWSTASPIKPVLPWLREVRNRWENSG